MPGIRFTFLRDEAQECWVNSVEELQPETHTPMFGTQNILKQSLVKEFIFY
jgi:hypothetical protein